MVDSLGDVLGGQSQSNQENNNNFGPLSGDSLPLFESQLNEFQIVNTRLRHYRHVPHVAFILGHEVFGVLGSIDGNGSDTNRLGLGSETVTLRMVTNYEEVFEEEFNNSRFIQDLGGATLDTSDRSITF